MEFSVEVEKISSIVRKLKIKIPSQEVKTQFDRSLVQVQKTAKLKGFRAGQVPLSMVKQFYGSDVRHQLFHRLIDDSIEKAVIQEKIQSVGRPKIETPEHQTGSGEHDHTLHEDQDLSFIATVEVMPELEMKNYKKLKLKKESTEVTDDHVDQVIENLRHSQAQLVPVAGSEAESGSAPRVTQKGDFLDVQISGGLVKEGKVIPQADMNGSKMVELGSNSWIPGFEDQLMGMSQGETRTFRLKFPEDFIEKTYAGQEGEFNVTLNELKEKKLAPLDDEFAQQLGYENLSDFKIKAKEMISRERVEQAERKLRSDLLGAVIEKNPFEVPSSMIQAQARILAEEWARDLKKQGYPEKMIEQIVRSGFSDLLKRAQNQVMGSLALESIAKSESIAVSAEEVQTEISNMASSMKMELDQLKEFYAKNPGRAQDLEFRLRQERTMKFLLESAEIS
ncbi:MAG: trigger factor [Bdellovibrionia bacterium]